jgi:hypothetical protein
MTENPRSPSNKPTDCDDQSADLELLSILERATADPATPLDTDDEQVKSLREGWLAMDQLLRAAADPVDIGDFTTPVVPVVAASAQSHRRHWRSRWSLVFASGSITCVTAVVVWLIACFRDADSPDKRKEPQRIAAVNGSSSTLDSQDGPVAEPIQWSDSLDDEITLMQERIRNFSRPADGEATYRSLSIQFELLREDFFDSDTL